MAAITTQPLRAQDSLERVSHPGAGAVLSFSGVVRAHHRGRKVLGIEYHAYEPMAQGELERIEEEARRRWPGLRVEILHRLGPLEVGEASVVIAVASAHRAEGFEALRYAIDTLKERVPIWKKEIYEDGHAWIEGS